MSKFLSRFRKNEDGASLVEYAVLIALLAVFLILTIQGLGITINSKFSAVNNMLANP
ncbi:Flp family type IVb pilin [Alsobacter sp. SYSU M60028]|uniref:Flp family type IVb pilin n=1 Tax=Alsobacter ponti TaxID=2962936 RepID=A0ABT1LA90_9HYPH|nr:Flp family type IVb pilin [Alsobacter ponti]MCP8937853.1 Flp family type IVb pilin [Alsobacter ponti]